MGLGKSIYQKTCTVLYHHVYREILNTSPFTHQNELNEQGKKKKGYTCVPYSLPVAFILNLCNLQVKRLVQLFSATTVAVRVHQKNLKLFFDFISYNTDLGSSS